MYVPIPEVISHAQSELIQFIIDRRYTYTAKNIFGLKKTLALNLYYIAIGRIRPTYRLMYYIREHISPVKWFYDTTEILPEAKKTNYLYHFKDKAEEKEEMNHSTAAHDYFKVLRDNWVYSAYIKERGLNVNLVRNYIFPRKKPDGKLYCVPPVYPFIRSLKKDIHPDFWFMSKDECDPQEFSEFLSQAQEYILEHKKIIKN